MSASRPSAAVLLAAFGIFGFSVVLFLQSRRELEGRHTGGRAESERLQESVVRAGRLASDRDRQLAEIRHELSESTRRLEKAYMDIAEMEKQIVDVSRAKNEIETELAYLRLLVDRGDLIQIGRCVPPPCGWKPNEPKIDGVVIEWSSDRNLVVISVGEREKVEVGYRFTVYRGSTYVSKLVVDRVGDDWSECRELKEFRMEAIQKSDSVSTRVFD